ncbi:MAG TPA: hypothetical protein VJQ52_20090 [Steroidobacteraceae bacterium]|nr:hypothetical protein [Steroidobacteraceae bacterium]
MRYVFVLLAASLCHAGAACAAESPIVLTTGIAAFQVDQPAPPELLEKLGPRLEAVGSEELRVTAIIEPPGETELLERWQSPKTIQLAQFIRGREVRQSWINIVFDVQTHEVTLVSARFLSDRGLNHEPRLTAAQARMRAQRQVRNPRAPVILDGTSARLAYDFEPATDYGELRGSLVWVFDASGLDSEPYEVSVSSATGKVLRMRGRVAGCFSPPPGEWTDLPLDSVELSRADRVAESG